MTEFYNFPGTSYTFPKDTTPPDNTPPVVEMLRDALKSAANRPAIAAGLTLLDAEGGTATYWVAADSAQHLQLVGALELLKAEILGFDRSGWTEEEG